MSNIRLFRKIQGKGQVETGRDAKKTHAESQTQFLLSFSCQQRPPQFGCFVSSFVNNRTYPHRQTAPVPARAELHRHLWTAKQLTFCMKLWITTSHKNR